jgi:hypothetical protein
VAKGSEKEKSMSLNRNHYFLLGTILLLLGLQFRLIDSVVLNEQSTRFLAQRLGTTTDAATAQVLHTTGFGAVMPRKALTTPKWVGWAFMSTGAVLVLHSIMLRKPD